MKNWKLVLAREWLIFVLLLPVGGIACFVYYQASEHHYPPFDEFWNDGFGFIKIVRNWHYGQRGQIIQSATHDWFPVLLWISPWLAVLFLRSLIWASKTLKSGI